MKPLPPFLYCACTYTANPKSALGKEAVRELDVFVSKDNPVQLGYTISNFVVRKAAAILFGYLLGFLLT